jgi:hypothetical protein
LAVLHRLGVGRRHWIGALEWTRGDSAYLRIADGAEWNLRRSRLDRSRSSEPDTNTDRHLK